MKPEPQCCQYIFTLVASSFICVLSWGLSAHGDAAIQFRTMPEPVATFDTTDRVRGICMPEIYAYLDIENLAEALGPDGAIVVDALEDLGKQVHDCLSMQFSDNFELFPWFSNIEASTHRQERQQKIQDQNV